MGNSSYHVNQTEGLRYSVERIEGYYNNLTEKVTRFPVPDNDIPITHHDNGTIQHFPIAIFQYGLAAYDLWLMRNENSDIEKFTNCVNWAVGNMQEDGSWVTFSGQNAAEPYSAMAQGEGISLLCRASIYFNNSLYTEKAEKAANFLLTPIDKGGVCKTSDSSLELYEFTYMPLVLNGWIFASWGLLDIYKLTGKNLYKEAWVTSVNTIAANLPKFDAGYWSYYNHSKNMASPFYHRLHIAQLNVLYDLTGIEEFRSYAKKWEKYQRSKWSLIRAFMIKAYQKIVE